MRLFFLFIFLFLHQIFCAQLSIQAQINLGEIAEAYEVKGFTVIENIGSSKLYLMRADADRGVKILTSKKTLQAGDTALLSIWFSPEKSGKFDKQISLVLSSQNDPSTIHLTGNLIKYKTDDRQACFYFGQRQNKTLIKSDQPILAQEAPLVRDNSNRLPDVSTTPTLPSVPIAQQEKVIEQKVISGSTLFPEDQYRPNNLVFLVDISGSMRDTLKLPLMKLALHQLIDGLREVDRITFITYADTIKVLKEAGSSKDKEALHAAVNQLKARGLTKGRRAILFSQEVAQRHFITGGSNLIIIATDGKFRFEKEDQKVWQDRQGDKKIILSTVAFGKEREALKNLKDIARKGEGSFVHITSSKDSSDKLLEEIRKRSRSEQ